MIIHPLAQKPNFDSHYLVGERKPGVALQQETFMKKCRRCGVDFITRSRVRKRCDACQAIVVKEKQGKANARLKAKRAERRNALESR